MGESVDNAGNNPVKPCHNTGSTMLIIINATNSFHIFSP